MWGGESTRFGGMSEQEGRAGRSKEASKDSEEPLRAEDLQGYHFFRKARCLLEGLQPCADHPNRQLHYDEYAALVLFYFFNPLLTSLRGLQAASDLPKVQKSLGIRRMSLGSMSESVHVFDPELLRKVFEGMAARAPNRPDDPQLQDLRQVLTVVDGTMLRALPRMTWALWRGEGERAAKAHLQLEVLKDTAVHVELTEAVRSEVEVLKGNLKAGRLYVMDRGYRDMGLLQAIHDADSSFVVRLHENAAYEVIQENELTREGGQSGVLWDGMVRLGSTPRLREKLAVPVRLVRVMARPPEPRSLGRVAKRVSSKKTFREPPGTAHELIIVTDRVDLPSDVIALIYRRRWRVELFFRMLKCLLGCTHLLSDSLEGVTIQLYCALIAALLLAEWTGLRPTKRVYEMVGLYLQGWAEPEDVARVVARELAKQQAKKG